MGGIWLTPFRRTIPPSSNPENLAPPNHPYKNVWSPNPGHNPQERCSSFPEGCINTATLSVSNKASFSGAREIKGVIQYKFNRKLRIFSNRVLFLVVLFAVLLLY